MRKKGVSLSFNTIIIAIIALTVLIVIISIYTGFIGRTSKSIDEPAKAAGLEASDAAWCLTEVLRGGTCAEYDSTKCSPSVKEGKEGEEKQVCKDTAKQRHSINKAETTLSQRYQCCQ